MRLVISLALLFPLTPAIAQTAPTFPVPDTGQTLCYDDRGPLAACPSTGQPFHGQDGTYVLASPRDRDNGDGTVSDLVTGLMWQTGYQRDVGFAQAAALAADRVIGQASPEDTWRNARFRSDGDLTSIGSRS